MMVWKVIECLEGAGCIGVEGDSVLAGTVKIFEGVNGGLVMLVTWIGTIGC